MGAVLFYIHCSTSDAISAVPEAARATTITVAAIAEGKSSVS